jgi:hypothetical protein
MSFDINDDKSSVWKHENAKGYQYASWDKLGEIEPEITALLKKEAGYRAQTARCYYYVNFHEKFGWSVARRRKDFSLSQQQGQTSEQALECPKLDTTDAILAEILRIVQRVEARQQGENYT